MPNRRDVLRAAAAASVAAATAGSAQGQDPAGPYDDPTARFEPGRQDELPEWAFRDPLHRPLVPRPVAVGTYEQLTTPVDGKLPAFAPDDPVPLGRVFHGIAREWAETPEHWGELGCPSGAGKTPAECWNDKINSFGRIRAHTCKADDKASDKQWVRNWGGLPIKCYKIPILETLKTLGRSTLPARLYGYAGMVPGPTYKFRLGQPVVVRYVNHLETEVSVHLHGAHSPSHSDGFPSFYVLQGKSRDYFYPNILPLRHQRPGEMEECDRPEPNPAGLVVDDGEAQSTMWYHDHGMDGTGYNVAKGLAGFALCFGERELELIRTGVLPGLKEKSCEDPERYCVETDPEKIKALEDPEHPGFYCREQEPYRNPYDIPIVLQDRVIDPATGQVAFDGTGHNGYLGHTFVLNGVAYPYLEVKNRKYRFRFLNGSNARVYRLRILSEADFHARRGEGPVSVPAVGVEAGDAEAENQRRPGGYDETSAVFLRIGKDSWLWNRAERRQSVVLMMANRADLVVDFKALAPELKAGEEAVFYLVNTMPQTDGRGPGVVLDDGGDPRVFPLPFELDPDEAEGIPEVRIPELDRPIGLMKIIVQGPPATDDACVEHGTELIEHHPIGDDEVQVVREFIFERGKGAWMINGRFYDPNIANATPSLGTAEEWVLRNGGGGWWHPIHIHLESHQLISYRKDFDADAVVDTADPPAIPQLNNLVELIGKVPEVEQRGLHDTQALGPNTVARIRLRFRTWNGPFVFHCHNLEHEDMRMMHNFEPVPRPYSDDPELSRLERQRRRANIAPDARTHGNDVTYQPEGRGPGGAEPDPATLRVGELEWHAPPVPLTPVEDAAGFQIPPRPRTGP
jgi:FtsP/CotA-like multicopper oxidase with cupredoxin domain